MNYKTLEEELSPLLQQAFSSIDPETWRQIVFACMCKLRAGELLLREEQIFVIGALSALLLPEMLHRPSIGDEKESNGNESCCHDARAPPLR